MNTKVCDHTTRLTIIGKGSEVEKMQKRLRCAARATGTDLHLSWQHEYPNTLNIDAEHATAVSYNNKLVLNSCSEYRYTLGIAVRPELVEGQID